jgi:nucleotidyltransferase substrate binding protein (TIGR01987 family)
MINNKSIRWKQRFSNFQNAYFRLKEALDNYSSLDDLGKEGLIQRFEYTFELAWKTLKDYLESKNVEAKYPRDTIKQAFSHNLIDNGEVWLEMLDNRNSLAHTYNENNLNAALIAIKDTFFVQIDQLYSLLKNEAK